MTQMATNCECVSWVRNSKVPEKVIILKCNRCRTEYTLYPNGEIAFNIPSASITIKGGTF